MLKKTSASQSSPTKPPLRSDFPIVGKPWQRRFPTPNIGEYIISVRKDTRTGEFRMPNKGDTYDGIDQRDRLSPKFTFFTAVPVEQQPGFVDLYYLAPFENQDEYNYTIEFPYADKDYPRYTRTYIVPRTDNLAKQEQPADAVDPVYGEPFQLTDHKIERITDDAILDANFVRVIRVFERLPSPVIISYESNQAQQVVQVLTQEVKKGSPPVQSAVTEQSKQERIGTAKAKNIVTRVPRVFPATGLTTEIPSMTRELWLGGFSEQAVTQIMAGIAVQPILNNPGDYSITQKQTTEFKKEVTLRTIPLPQERHHKEFGPSELGAPVMSVDLNIDTPTSPLDIEKGFTITESRLRNLAGFGKVRETKRLLEQAPDIIQLIAGGDGYTSPPTVVFTPAGASALALIGKNVTAVSVINSGSDYDFPPPIQFLGGSPQRQAAAIAILGYSIQDVFLSSPGIGYTSAPTIVFQGGSGTGATATATVSGGQVTGITITNPGKNYTVPPTILIQGGAGTGALATAELTRTGILLAINVIDNGAGYLATPTVLVYGGKFVPKGIDAIATATLSTASQVYAVLLQAQGLYFIPPAITFSGGVGTGAMATYVIGGTLVAGWPVLKGSLVNKEYGLITQITKDVIPAGTQWDPTMGKFVDITPHDEQRSIRITSIFDPRSLPPPILYPTVQDIHLPGTLIDIIPDEVEHFDTGYDVTQAIFPIVSSPSQGYSASITSAIQGAVSILSERGFSGPAAAMVKEEFFHPLPPGAVNGSISPFIILPVNGFVSLVSEAFSHSHGENLSRSHQTDNSSTQYHTTHALFEGLMTGKFIAGLLAQQSKKQRKITQKQALKSGYYRFSESVVSGNPSCNSDYIYGISFDVCLKNAPSLTLTMNIPISTPATLSVGDSYLYAMETHRLELDVWMVRSVYITIPPGAV